MQPEQGGLRNAAALSLGVAADIDGDVIGLRSQFALSIIVVLVVGIVAVAATSISVGRARSAGLPWIASAARIMAAASVVTTLAATAMPRRLAIEADGDLALQLGRGGLGDWSILFNDPTSLASIALLGNVLLYVPVAFTTVVGWYRWRRLVLPVCLALSIGIEMVQYLALGRVAALDDIVLNMTGAVIGYVAATAACGKSPARLA